MDELINVLIFVGTIVVFIVSAIRKNKGKSEKSPNDFSSSIASFFGDVTVDQRKEQEVVVEHPTPKEHKPFSRYQSIAESMKDKKVRNDISEVIKNTEINDNPNSSIDFDLRSAIIYKEILDRKEF